ncbi:MAG: hypothetical protein ABFD64_05715 [Armatimonadota bacterium]
MRFTHKVRSITTAAVLLGSVLFTAASALAITIASPTENRLVRDKVPIVIPRYSLPAEVARAGFITVKVDGRFLAAVDASIPPVTGKAPLNPNIVYMWDTKRSINDTTLPADQRSYRDGRHVIRVEAFSIGSATTSKDVAIESATVNVTLQNQVQRPNPAPPVRMKYHYYLGTESRYKVSTTCEVLDATGYSLTGGQAPVLGEYDVIQMVEDLEPSGSALLRYKVDKDSAFTQMFGQVSLLGQSQKYQSVYKLVDVFGRVIDASVMSERSKVEVTDCLLSLPGYPIQVGDKWPTSMHMKLEGLSSYGKYKGTSVLENLEWEGGYECAKIVSNISGSATLYFLGLGKMDEIRAVNTAYFAYKPGKLLKDVTLVEFGAVMSNETVAAIQQQMPAPKTGSDTASSGSQSLVGGNSGSYMPGMPPSAAQHEIPGFSSSPRMSGGGMSAGGASGTGQTQVRIRLTITKELVKNK